MENLKKQYRYYKKIEATGNLNTKQQEKLKQVETALGEHIPHQKVKQTPEERVAKRHEYYLSHKNKIIEYQKQWNKQNRNKCAEYNKKAYQKKKCCGTNNEENSSLEIRGTPNDENRVLGK